LESNPLVLFGNVNMGHVVLTVFSSVFLCSAADVLLWKDKKTSAAVVGGATILWVLFEVVEYHLLTLVSHVLIVALTILFLWSNATVFINKSPPNVPEVQISEDLAVNIALRLRADINKALGLLREIALGHDLMKFLGVNVKEPFSVLFY